MATTSSTPFKPALIVVDFQEDFCPPNGSLAVEGGRDIASAINKLLALPFAIKVATKDWHPQDHISFASNHPPPENVPFATIITIQNPLNASETQETRLWPDHCVQNSPGAQLIPELDVTRIDHVIEKGQDTRVEMYSAFYDPFHVSDSGIKSVLKEKGVTHVYVVGLAFDYCVKSTAIDAASEGFVTYVIGNATKAVDPSAWAEVEKELEGKGVKMIDLEGEEVKAVC